jgi:Flp pilus assembly protein TadD
LLLGAGTPAHSTYNADTPDFMKAHAASGDRGKEGPLRIVMPAARSTSFRQRAARPGTGNASRSPEDEWQSLLRWQSILVALGLALLAIAVYSPVLRCQFVNYDDNHYVTENVHVRSGLTWTTFTWALTTTEQANWHPLTWLSHALDCQLFGLDAAAHHATSALIHAVNVTLLFLLLLRATGATGRSGLVAALFAIHPLSVESVAWVAERKNELCTLFFLLSLGAYGWYARRPSARRYSVVAILFAFGLASKPMVITLPFALLLLDFWPLRRVQGWPRSSTFPVVQATFGRLVLEKIPLFVLSAASAVITIIAQRLGGAMPSTMVLPFGTRLLNGVHSYAAYIWKAFWPVYLAPFYPGSPLTAWQLALPAGFLIGISILVWRSRGSRPYLVTGWLWYLGTMFPMIGLIQVGGQAMADRYTYIPLIGIFVAIVWAAGDLMERTRIPLVTGVTMASVVLLLLGFLTVRQISYWQTSVDLWSHTLQATKNNLVAEDNLGVALLALGDNEGALPHFQNAAKINPLDPLSHVNIGADYQEHEQWSAALAEYTTAASLTVDPNLLTVIYKNLGSVYRQLGDFSRAEESYQQVLKIDPRDQTAFLALGVLRRDNRIRDLQRSLAEQPNADGYLELGQLLQQAGRTNDARDAYQKSVQLGDKSGKPHKALTTPAGNSN